MRFLDKNYFYIAIGGLGLVLDQITKFWAHSHSQLSNWEHWVVPVIGSGDGLLNFILRYNEGAAFSKQPHTIIPWLSPTVFYGILTGIACIGAVYFFRSVHKQDYLSKLSIVLIIAGALGNFCDRLRIGMVIDFIDVAFPIIHRWPTFNLADSWVTIGITLLFVGSYFMRQKKT
jgi:signal peptidase II